MKRKKLLNWWNTEPRFIRGVFSAPPRLPLVHYELHAQHKLTSDEVREAPKGNAHDHTHG